LEKGTIHLLPCVAEQRSEESCDRSANHFDNSTFNFVIGFRFEKCMPKVVPCSIRAKGTKESARVFHVPEAQEIVLRAMISSADLFSKERLLLREITHSINNKCAPVTQPGLHGEAVAASLLSSRHSYGWMDFWVSGTITPFMARRRMHQALFATALFGTSLTPTFGAELISSLVGFQCR